MDNYHPKSARSKARQYKNIAKGTTDPRVEFISQVQTKILIKLHLQNLDQASTSKSQPNISILTGPSFRISTKIKLHNLNLPLLSLETLITLKSKLDVSLDVQTGF